MTRKRMQPSVARRLIKIAFHFVSTVRRHFTGRKAERGKGNIFMTFRGGFSFPKQIIWKYLCVVWCLLHFPSLPCRLLRRGSVSKSLMWLRVEKRRRKSGETINSSAVRWFASKPPRGGRHAAKSEGKTAKFMRAEIGFSVQGATHNLSQWTRCYLFLLLLGWWTFRLWGFVFVRRNKACIDGLKTCKRFV